MMFQMRAGAVGSDRVITCAAPNEYVEIGLEGQIEACCRAQGVSLGRVVSVDDFARTQFGANDIAIHRLLQRGATMPSVWQPISSILGPRDCKRNSSRRHCARAAPCIARAIAGIR